MLTRSPSTPRAKRQHLFYMAAPPLRTLASMRERGQLRVRSGHIVGATGPRTSKLA